MAAFGLTTPAMLLGAALVALPIAAHLLNRKARQRIVFPSVGLLTSVAASQSSLFKLRRWLLLALRCLAVLLVVLAFTRPTWLGGGEHNASAASSAHGLAVVIVLDVSASTQQTLEDGTTAADRLRGQANRELSRLAAGTDHANVVLADATPIAVFEHMTLNLDALQRAIDQAPPTDHRADLVGALSLAGELLSSQESAKQAKHVLVLTDAQQSNWDSLDDLALPPGVRVTIRSVGDSFQESAGNTALLEPSVRPATPGLGVPAELTAEVAHFGPQPTRVRVDLEIASAEVDSRWVRLGPGERKPVSFTRRFDVAQPQQVRFKLASNDSLAIDNTASLVVRCVERRPVIVISDTNPDDPDTAGYYVSRALAPHNNAQDRYVVTHLASASATPAALSGAAMVCIGDVRPNQVQLDASLLGYLQDGGSVLVFGGASPLRSNTLLPWTFNTRLAGAQITQGDWHAPELAGFDLDSQDALARSPLRRAWRVGDIRDNHRLLLSFGNGQPALGSRPVGRGQVVAATFSPALNSSEIGKHGVFVVLMQSLAERLTTKLDRSATASAGRPVRMTADEQVNPQGPASQVFAPDGQPLTDAVIGIEKGIAVANLPTAHQAGFYTWRQGPAVISVSAVNVDPRESDTRSIEADLLAAALARRGAASATVAGVSQANDSLGLRGTPLWGWALLGAIGAMCLEMGVLGVWRR